MVCSNCSRLLLDEVSTGSTDESPVVEPVPLPCRISQPAARQHPTRWSSTIPVDCMRA